MAEILDIVKGEEDVLETALFQPEKLPAKKTAALPVPSFESDASPNGLQEIARRVKAAFMSAKTPEEIYYFARSLPDMAWLDIFTKLMPKEVQVKGTFDVRQLVAQMGPISRGKKDA